MNSIVNDTSKSSRVTAQKDDTPFICETRSIEERGGIFALLQEVLQHNSNDIAIIDGDFHKNETLRKIMNGSRKKNGCTEADSVQLTATRKTVWSYEDLYNESLSFAYTMHLHGVITGDVFGLLMMNEPAFIISQFAISAAGATAANLSPKLNSKELSELVMLSNVKWLIIGSGMVEKIVEMLHILNDNPEFATRSTFAGLIWVHADDLNKLTKKCLLFSNLHVEHLCMEEFLGKKIANDSSSILKTLTCDDTINKYPYQIFFSSGTTGNPKAICHSQRSIITNSITCMKREYNVRQSSSFIHVAPMYHAMGNSAIFLACSLGGVQVTIRKFEAAHMIAAIHLFKVEVALLAPTMISILTKQEMLRSIDISTLCTISCGGANLDPVTLSTFIALVPSIQQYVNDYGMSECLRIAISCPDCPMSVSSLDYGSMKKLSMSKYEKLSSACTGRPMINVDLRIITNANDDVNEDEPGEIIVRSSIASAAQYIKRDDSYSTSISSVLDNDMVGWLRTGDYGIFVKVDGQFYVKVLDRIKSMIISGGLNVYAAEVESVIAEVPDVQQVGVYGMPDPILGEFVKAVIVLRPNSTMTSQSIRSHCITKLAFYKIPREIVVIPESEMPLTPMGKVKRNVLKSRDLERLKAPKLIGRQASILTEIASQLGQEAADKGVATIIEHWVTCPTEELSYAAARSRSLVVTARESERLARTAPWKRREGLGGWAAIVIFCQIPKTKSTFFDTVFLTH